MTDRYENIRLALAMGPTPGPWYGDDNSVSCLRSNGTVGIRKYIALPDSAESSTPNPANMHFIAACDPDTIRELLEERDALRQNAASSVQPELVAVALAACDAVDDLIEKWYATRESGCLPNQVVRARGASKLLRAIALEGTK